MKSDTASLVDDAPAVVDNHRLDPGLGFVFSVAALGAGPGEPDDHDRVVIPAEIHSSRHKTLCQRTVKALNRAGIKVVEKNVNHDRLGV